MAPLTKMGRTSLSLSGSSLALPASEKISVKSVHSTAQSRHTPILVGGTGGVEATTKGDTDRVFTDGTPGDAAILTPFRVDQTFNYFVDSILESLKKCRDIYSKSKCGAHYVRHFFSTMLYLSHKP